jgi:hypothetical protein
MTSARLTYLCNSPYIGAEHVLTVTVMLLDNVQHIFILMMSAAGAKNCHVQVNLRVRSP